MHRLIRKALNEIFDHNDYSKWKLKTAAGIPMDVCCEESPEQCNCVVGLWPGSGYTLLRFGVNVDYDDCMTAIEKAVAYMQNKGDYNGFFVDESEVEPDEHGDDPEGLLYVDPTLEGGQQPTYIFSENLKFLFDKDFIARQQKQSMNESIRRAIRKALR